MSGSYRGGSRGDLVKSAELPTYTYRDVSRDPNARARANVSEATRGCLRALGYRPLGHVAAVSNFGFVLVNEVWSEGGSFVSAETFQGAEIVAFSTLLRDGTVISTTQNHFTGWQRWVVPHGVRKSAASGYDHAAFRVDDISTLEVLHAARVRRAVAETGSSIVEANDLTTNIAIRIRYRELAERALQVQYAVAGSTSMVVGTLTLGLVVIAWIRNWVGGLAALGLAFALSLFLIPVSDKIGLLIFGPIVARRQEANRVPADDLIERAKRIAFGEIPPEP
jgi:hypothetical protein